MSGTGLTEFGKVGGDTDKLSPSSRTLLSSTASKNLGDAIRAKTAAATAEDADEKFLGKFAVWIFLTVLAIFTGADLIDVQVLLLGVVASGPASIVTSTSAPSLSATTLPLSSCSLFSIRIS